MKPKLRLVRTEKPSLVDKSPLQWPADRRELSVYLPIAGWLLFLLLFSPGRVMDFDVAIRAQIGRALWSEGTVTVAKGSLVDSGLVWTSENRGTSFYGMGQSLFLIPFDMAGAALSFFAHDDKTKQGLNAFPIAFGYVPLMGALWFLLLALWLQTWGLDREDSFSATAVYFLATPAFYYATQSAQEEALVATLGLASLCLAKRAADSTLRNKRALFVCGVLAGFTLLVRLNSLFFFLPVLGLLIDSYRDSQHSFKRSWTNLRFLILGGLIPVSLHLLFAYWRFGSITSFGYDQARAQGIGVWWTSFQWDIAIGFLFGLGKGLFILGPVLLFAFVGARSAFGSNPACGIATALAFFCSCIFHAHIANNPDGSECWSVRYLMHLTSLLVLPAWHGFQIAQERDFTKALSYVAVAIGTFFSLLSLMAPNSLEYTQTYAEDKPQKTLLLSWPDGQLARRAKNLSLHLSEEPLQDGYSPELQRGMAVLSAEYMPNLWPWVFAKKLPRHAVWFWVAWLALLAISAKLLFFQPKPKRARRLTLL